MAFEEEGFCITRGPDLLWGGDIKRFHPPAGRFDGLIGGPPCQAFSRLRHIVEANGYQVAENLIPEFERCIAEAEPRWFLMENVPDAPVPAVNGYTVSRQIVEDVWVGGETSRRRMFSFGRHWSIDMEGGAFHIETLALHRPDPDHSALASGSGRPVPVAVGGSGKRKISHKSALKNYGYKTAGAFENSKRLQGLPADFDLPPFTIAAKVKAVGNGVPRSMGIAVARAVKSALSEQEQAA
ncbi:MAG: DNA cytosine methyltransferase [Hyphomicrobiales bacterium]|nr:DNA cytosine methyltransferase [Hyphomicrobiales bacterium]